MDVLSAMSFNSPIRTNSANDLSHRLESSTDRTAAGDSFKGKLNNAQKESAPTRGEANSTERRTSAADIQTSNYKNAKNGSSVARQATKQTSRPIKKNSSETDSAQDGYAQMSADTGLQAKNQNYIETDSTDDGSQSESIETNSYENVPNAVGSKANGPYIENLKGSQFQQLADADQPSMLLSDRIENLRSAENKIVDPLTRRVAIQSFVNKMREEFGINPMDVVKAFSQLSTEELGLPPQLTVNRVINQLDLNPEQKFQAATYFHQMLQKTAATSMADYLKGSGRQLSLEVLSKREMSQRNLDASLEKLNQNFFAAKDSNKKEGEQKNTLDALISGQWHPNKARMDGNLDWSPQVSQSGTALADQTLSTQSFEPTSMVQTQRALSAYELQSPTMDSFESSEDPGMQLVSSEYSVPKGNPLGQMGLDLVPKIQQNNLLMNEATKPLQVLDINKLAVDMQMGKTAKIAAASDSQSEDFSNQAESDGAGTDAMMAPYADNQQTEFSPNVAKGFQVKENIQPNDMEQAQNVRELVNQSQVMIKNGGGEMKVQLRPDGLGEVNLKVHVDKGQVNVEMVADNNNAKKLIEKGLGELKATLASHKLNVDQIKVDVSQGMTQDMQHRFDEGEREFARQFMQDFRQQNQSFREGNYFGGFSNVKSQTDEESDDAYRRVQTNNARRPTNTERRLDLVA